MSSSEEINEGRIAAGKRLIDSFFRSTPTIKGEVPDAYVIEFLEQLVSILGVLSDEEKKLIDAYFLEKNAAWEEAQKN